MSTSQVTSDSIHERQVAVWDPLVRLGHWTLVIAFATAYLTSEEGPGAPDALHVWSGYVVGGIVVLRVLWGFVGTRHARFKDFAFGPFGAARYLIGLASGRAPRYLGHSPAGGVMVIALLALLAGTVGTGLIAYGEKGKGPLAGVAVTSVAPVHTDENAASEPRASRRGEGKESSIDEIHKTLANITLWLVILHTLGVGFASMIHRENLVASMFHGRKRAED